MTYTKPLFLLTVLLSSLFAIGYSAGGDTISENPSEDYVTIAILAKDKEGTLPLYLECLGNQTWPRDKTYIYVRTNNNNDGTVEVLKEWLEKNGSSYAGVYFDDKDVAERVQDFQNHEWNATRFKVLGKIRQDSVEWAREHDSHYFVVDCDNFIVPETLEKLMSVNVPVVAPFLRCGGNHLYANYHAAVDGNGYCAETPVYNYVLNQIVKGLIELPVVHCSYLIRKEYLDRIVYDDDSYRYEYVIFSDNLRKRNIPQYLDNRELYGRITFANTLEGLNKETWLDEFQN